MGSSPLHIRRVAPATVSAILEDLLGEPVETLERLPTSTLGELFEVAGNHAARAYEYGNPAASALEDERFERIYGILERRREIA